MFSCIATPDPAFTVTGTVGATDCDQEKNFGSGCTVTGGEAGYALNALGGGVWVMAFEVRVCSPTQTNSSVRLLTSSL